MAAAAAAAAGETADGDDSASVSSEDPDLDENDDDSSSPQSKVFTKDELSHIKDIAQDVHDCSACEESELDYVSSASGSDRDDDDDNNETKYKNHVSSREAYEPPVLEPKPEEICTANKHLKPRRNFEKTFDELSDEFDKLKNKNHTSLRSKLDCAQRTRKIIEKTKWRMRQVNLRRDPLRKLLPRGYTSTLWGNMATFRLFFYRRCALVIVLGGEDDIVDFNTILGPPIKETYPEGMHCHLCDGEEDCYQY